MIEEPPVLAIHRSIERPDRTIIERFARANSCWIADARFGRAAMDAAIKPIIAGKARFCGPAVTCNCGVNDNLAILAALSVVQPGDVLVASTEGFEGAAILGDVLANLAHNNGVAGFITDGMVRDLEGLSEAGVPIFARGLNPNSCVKSGPGVVGAPIQVGGVKVASGDIVVADEDGVAIVPTAEIDVVSARLDQIESAEGELVKNVKSGLKQMASIEELLASDAVKYID